MARYLNLESVNIRTKLSEEEKEFLTKQFDLPEQVKGEEVARRFAIQFPDPRIHPRLLTFSDPS